MSWEIITLTPIWSGDVDRDSPSVHETSIIGSLRWWYREILRSHAPEKVCDVTSEEPGERCPWKFSQPCPVCHLFGCTGRARQFRLEVQGLEPMPLFFVTHPDVYVSNGTWLTNLWGGKKTGRGRDARYELPSQALFVNATVKRSGLSEYFTMKVSPLRPESCEDLDKLNKLLYFIVRYGALGARTHNGFGQIALVDGEQPNLEEMMPHSERFFSLTFELTSGLGRYRDRLRFVGEPPPGFQDHARAPFIPCAFDLRYKTSAKNPFTGAGENLGLRPYFREHWGQQVADALFGQPVGRKSKSRIHVSHLYRHPDGGPFRIKVFGFIPPTDNGVKLPWIREIKDAVKHFITDRKIFPGSTIIDELPPSAG